MYKDNAINRKLNRVGMKFGSTCPQWEEPEEKKPKVKAIIVKKKKKFVITPKEEPKKEEPKPKKKKKLILKKEEPEKEEPKPNDKRAQEIAELKAFSKQQKKIKKAMMTKPPKEEHPKIEKISKEEKLVQKHSKDDKQKVFWDRGIRDIIFGKKKQSIQEERKKFEDWAKTQDILKIRNRRNLIDDIIEAARYTWDMTEGEFGLKPKTRYKYTLQDYQIRNMLWGNYFNDGEVPVGGYWGLLEDNDGLEVWEEDHPFYQWFVDAYERHIKKLGPEKRYSKKA